MWGLNPQISGYSLMKASNFQLEDTVSSRVTRSKTTFSQIPLYTSIGGFFMLNKNIFTNKINVVFFTNPYLLIH